MASLAARICDHCRKQGIEVVLSGGACVSIYARNRYLSNDLDFVLLESVNRSRLRAAMRGLGFEPEGRHFRHPETPFLVEFLLPPLSVGGEPVREVRELKRGRSTLRLLSPTDCVKDRLASYYHWNDRPSLDQAILVCRAAAVDLAEVERWSSGEGMGEGFRAFERALQAGGSGVETMKNSRVTIYCAAAVALAVLAPLPFSAVRQASSGSQAAVVEAGDFRFQYDERGISALANPRDPFGATLMPSSGPRAGGGAPVLGLVLRYRLAGSGGDWTELSARGPMREASPDKGIVRYASGGAPAPLEVVETYRTDGRLLDWTVELASTGPKAVEVGDLGVSVPSVGPTGENPFQIFERGFLRHQFVSGHGSFFFFVRASGAPPFLLVTVLPGTKLEYTAGGGRGLAQFFVHSARTGGAETRGTWRQPHTALELAPAGRPGSQASYGFRMQWAASYEDLRGLLFREGLFDVRVVPGMTLPENLTARFSLHTKAEVDEVRPEFPAQTRVRSLPSPAPDHLLYEVSFEKLGENMLTIVHDGGRRTYLEFFVTEPIETLVKKRARFLVEKQQVKDPSKWWNGVYAPYDMEAKKIRTVEDPDIFLDRMVYVLTCDDPGLSKAPYLASKNVVFPDKKEVESLEYYLKNFVWGGLQRRDDERPYPYGVYGTPHWFINRDPARRKAYAESLNDGAKAAADLGKEHVWRSYDYPHVVMLYFHMYEIAKLYPGMSTYLDAAGYLERAWQTARAFYTYPYEIYPSYYETYKWGLYNELVVLDLIGTLEREGFPSQAAWLRAEWEKKTKYFVYDDPYPFRSEYAFDRTAFESSYALAKYGATRDMAPDRNLWYDIKLKKWHSHPLVRREDSRAFMDRQLASGLAVRGWLNPAYYTLGCDPGVSYMAAMGGWGVLDYALNFAPRPFDWLGLGYASYLSSWCLMNTGRPETNYGFWYPGPENDGASGWQFQSAKAGGAWMGSSYPGGVTVPRGPWRYDGEIDLGYGGALRMAAAIVARDPVFGWIAYGGAMKEGEKTLEVDPRDGLRRRFQVIIPDPSLPFPEDIQRLKIELGRDGFLAGGPIVLDKALGRIYFIVENRTADAHRTEVRLSFPVHARYELRREGVSVPLVATGSWDYPLRAELDVAGPRVKVELVLVDRKEQS